MCQYSSVQLRNLFSSSQGVTHGQIIMEKHSINFHCEQYENSQANQSPGLDSSQVPSKYEAQLLITTTQCYRCDW
jgi:hypothetical protein